MAVPIDPKMIEAVMGQARTGYPAATSLIGKGMTTASKGAESVGGVSGFAKGNIYWLLPMILSMLAGKEIKRYGERKTTEIETEHIREMKESLSPEDMMYQAMMPAVQQEQQMVSAILLQQLLGGSNLGPQLARGEERIGGQRSGLPGF